MVQQDPAQQSQGRGAGQGTAEGPSRRRRVAASRLPIRRVTTPGGIHYERSGRQVTGRAEIRRIEALAIPPAWTEVEIARSPRAKVLARGRDAAGRLQAIYGPSFRQRRDREKFDRMGRFAKQLPAFRRQIDRDLRKRKFTKEKVVACVLAVIDARLLRVGSPASARERAAFGATTLRRRHTKVSATSVTFDFHGKSGKLQHVVIRDRRLAGIVQRLVDMPGHELFRYLDDDGAPRNVEATDVNAYVRRHLGEEFTAKDFRTWGGTVAAAEALARDGMVAGLSQREREKRIRAAVKESADRLGNTPAIARASYIDPRLLAAFQTERSVARVRTDRRWRRGPAELSPGERLVKAILD